MPRVYTGKVLIPGDKIEAYFAAMKEAEVARAPFRQSLEALNEDFGAFLATKYTRKTVRKHTGTIALFIDFLCDYTDAERLEDVTRGMVNSQFRAWYKRKVLWDMDPTEVHAGLKKFFGFLDQQKGLQAPKALEALRSS
jgi:hypothetical protein